MADDIRRWSDELARDPSSLVFLQLGEALRRQRQLEPALKIALRGLERHPHRADAHDLLARIFVDHGELQRAFDEWDMVLRIAPAHVGALKGMGYVCFQLGRIDEAERYLERAAALEPDAGIDAALANVRRSGTVRLPVEDVSEPAPPAREAPPAARTTATPAAPPAPAGAAGVAGVAGVEGFPEDTQALFATVLHGADQAAMLLDADGLVLAGAYVVDDGRDVAQDVGAELSGVSDEARRATRHLGIGDWRAIVIETESAVVAMSPAGGDGLLVLTASRQTPLGLLRRLLDACGARARGWLAHVAEREGGGGGTARGGDGELRP